MKILIAADGTTLDSSVAKRFGHAPYYLYVDSGTIQTSSRGSARGVQVIDNTGHHDESHAIIPQMVKQGAEVFIAGNIGPHAFQLVRSLDRQVALARKMLVREALEKWQAGKLEILSAPTVKRSFHDHTHH